MDIGYDFTIYVAGPYSRHLNCDYYPNEVKSRIDALETTYELTDSDIVTLDKIKSCRGLLENQTLLEATSTAVYLMMQNPDQSEDRLFITLRWLKPHLSESDRVIGISKAKELLFRSDYFTEELKQELNEWDKLES
jgi:hypothetical protein